MKPSLRELKNTNKNALIFLKEWSKISNLKFNIEKLEEKQFKPEAWKQKK